MNAFTREELKDALMSLPILNGSIVTSKNGLLINSELFVSYVFLDPILEPKDFLPYSSEIHSKDLKELSIIRELIYHVPLHLVPLHINTSPEIAAWRLRVGK